MNHKLRLCAPIMGLLVFTATTDTTTASIIVNVYDDGPNLRILGDGGSVDLSGLTVNGTSITTSVLLGTANHWLPGRPGTATSYNSLSGASFSSSGTWSALSFVGASFGEYLGIHSDGRIFTDQPFSSGVVSITPDTIVLGESLASAGISPGATATVTWDAGGGNLQTISYVASAPVSPVPEASEALVVLLGLTGLLAGRRRSE